MWPRIALWVAGFLAVPAAKYIYENVFAVPKYWDEVAKANEKKSAQEKADHEELERLRAERKEMQDSSKDPNILYRKF
jgi:hypothetical protein